MTITRDKLNEAKFFLEHMQSTQFGPEANTQNGRDAFKYFLSAFLSAARSVTKLPGERDIADRRHEFYDWYLEKEFGSAEGFESWYQNKCRELQGDTTMEIMKSQRDFTIHYKNRQPMSLIHNTAVLFKLFIPVSSSGVLVSTPVGASEEEVQAIIASAAPASRPPVAAPPSETIITHSWFFAGLSEDKDVLTICQEHFTKLERLVNECESFVL